MFNQQIKEKTLPNSLKKITFGYMFNHYIDQLPQNLEFLTLGEKFAKPVGNTLPNSITHLTFGNKFNQPINSLPINLQFLTLGYGFDKIVENLPSEIKQINVKTTYALDLIKKVPFGCKIVVDTNFY
jgi:hypothetical protein